MKTIYILLLLLIKCFTSCSSNCIDCDGIHCIQCMGDYFLSGNVCISCKASTCEECDGTNTCVSCSSEITMVNGLCTKCIDSEKMVIHKTCVTCTEVGCARCSEVDNTMCNCPNDRTSCCDTSKGVYQGRGSCVACDASIGGCELCSGAKTCTSCLSGFVFVEGAGFTRCEDYTSYLSVVICLTIVFITLL